MKKQPKFEKGDVVLIEYKPISPVAEFMRKYNFTLGVVCYTLEGSNLVYIDNEWTLYWPNDCLTLISKGDFK